MHWATILFLFSMLPAAAQIKDGVSTFSTSAQLVVETVTVNPMRSIQTTARVRF